jgi:ribonuclease HI
MCRKTTTGCYGVIAVVCDNIIDQNFKLVSNTTSNNSEIKGLRAAVSMANKWKDCFRFINIFSDSQISVFGLRDYIYNWRYNPNDGLLYGSANKPIVNQEIFIETHYILTELMQITNSSVRLFHQSGHIENGYDKLIYACKTFKKSNKINGKVDINFIRYISTYNNYVDNKSRQTLRNSNRSLNYIDPISFSYKI